MWLGFREFRVHRAVYCRVAFDMKRAVKSPASITQGCTPDSYTLDAK